MILLKIPYQHERSRSVAKQTNAKWNPVTKLWEYEHFTEKKQVHPLLQRYVQSQDEPIPDQQPFKGKKKKLGEDQEVLTDLDFDVMGF